MLNARAISSAARAAHSDSPDAGDLEEDAMDWEVADPKRAAAAGREIPPETINHLLLLPGAHGHRGWMHLSATYLLLRNETLFHHDAWMATMAATVCYLLTQVLPLPR